MKKLTRRQFIKLSSTVVAAGLLTGCDVASKPRATREDVLKFHPDALSKVVHTHYPGVWAGAPTDGTFANSAEENSLLVPETLREMLDASITALTGLDEARAAWAVLFSPDERIGIKVNAFRNSLIWTHAPLVTAVTDSLQEAGIPAEQIVIFDYYTTELEEAGFSINEDGPGVRCYGNGSNYTQAGTVDGMNIGLSDTLLACDALINMPVLKSHMISGVSFAMKNHYGSVSAPSLLHSNIGNRMAELNALSPIKDRTRLIVGDALTACLEYRGAYPYWSSDWAGDSILMSFDPVAMDTIALQMLSQLLTDAGGNPASILGMATPCLESGAALGLGTDDLANVDLQEITLG
jgi:uncharacterized protein (DUF362 family)